MFDCPLATNTSPMYTVFRWNTVWSPYATVSSYGVSLAGSASSVVVNRLSFTVAFPARRVPSPVSVTVIAEASTSPSCRAISPLSVIGASRCSTICSATYGCMATDTSPDAVLALLLGAVLALVLCALPHAPAHTARHSASSSASARLQSCGRCGGRAGVDEIRVVRAVCSMGLPRFAMGRRAGNARCVVS